MKQILLVNHNPDFPEPPNKKIQRFLPQLFSLRFLHHILKEYYTYSYLVKD
jgi:hypothetical protein